MPSARDKIVKAAGLLMSLQLVAQAAGLFKQVVIAALFGTSETMDAYLVAMALVGVIVLWVRQPIRQTLVPMFRYDLTRRGEPEAWANFSVLLNNLVLVMAFIAIAGTLLAPYLVGLIAPGFDRETGGLATSLARITMATVLFVGVGGVLSQVFYSYERFLLPGMKDGAGDVVMITALLALSGMYGVYGLAVAVLLGSLAQVVLQLPILWEKRKLYRPKVNPRHPGMAEMGRLSFPLLISTGGTEVARITDRIFASLLSAGSISALSFANGLVSKPFEFITQPLHKVTYPHFTKLSAEQDFDTMSRQFFYYVRLVFFLTVPVAIGAMLVAEPLVRLVYQRGAFDETSVRLTSQALLFYAIGLPASVMATILNRTFFGLKDTWTPTKTALLRIGLKILLSWVLIRPLAHLGIALAESVSQIVRVLFLFLLLPSQVKGAEGWNTVRSFARTLAACLAMAAVVYVAKGRINGALGAPLELGILLLLGASSYAALAFALQGREFRSVVQALVTLTAKRSLTSPKGRAK